MTQTTKLATLLLILVLTACEQSTSNYPPPFTEDYIATTCKIDGKVYRVTQQRLKTVTLTAIDRYNDTHILTSTTFLKECVDNDNS